MIRNKNYLDQQLLFIGICFTFFQVTKQADVRSLLYRKDSMLSKLRKEKKPYTISRSKNRRYAESVVV